MVRFEIFKRLVDWACGKVFTILWMNRLPQADIFKFQRLWAAKFVKLNNPAVYTPRMMPSQLDA
jgi:hypothetical protein